MTTSASLPARSPRRCSRWLPAPAARVVASRIAVCVPIPIRLQVTAMNTAAPISSDSTLRVSRTRGTLAPRRPERPPSGLGDRAGNDVNGGGNGEGDDGVDGREGSLPAGSS